MSNSITQEKYNEIEQLVNCALSANSKAQAEPYLQRLSFIGNAGGYTGYLATVLSSLVSSTSNAAGRVQDKERKEYFANTDLCKLKGLIRDEADGGNGNGNN